MTTDGLARRILVVEVLTIYTRCVYARPLYLRAFFQKAHLGTRHEDLQAELQGCLSERYRLSFGKVVLGDLITDNMD
jgi:hypothetical protein